MTSFLNLPSPPLPPPLLTLQKAATRQEPGSGYSTNLRPLRTRLTPATAHLPNPFIPPPTTQNQLMIQGFEWYLPFPTKENPTTHWQRLKSLVPFLSQLGTTHLWIPPACKASVPDGNGYDIYDLYDLGEFDQKGCTQTKWGTKQQLVDLTATAKENGVKILFDTVLNHKAGADIKESTFATKMDPKDRMKPLEEKREVQVWTGFDFVGGKREEYSGMKWRKEHFTGVDYDDLSKENGVFKLEGKEWKDDVDEELGNYDFLMFADVDHGHAEVREDLFRWIDWLGKESGLNLGGLRMDAIKHYSFRFLKDFLMHVQVDVGKDWFIVGEYWRVDSEFLARVIEYMDHRLSLFDVQLVHNFSEISMMGERGDLRKVLDDALVVWKPENVVTFVVNHDTQAGQSLETPVAPFFIPIAYALLLLRANTGLPCVFWSDLFGSFTKYPNLDHGIPLPVVPPTSGGKVLPKMMLARKLWAYGPQHDYFNCQNCVGFTRLGHPSQSGGNGLAVVITNAWEYASKKMFVGTQHAGEVWTDLLKWCPGQVVIDSEGWGVFSVGHQSVSVWVNINAQGRGIVDVLGLQ
ncbi:alpha-amylase [Podospora fimiseda]|uniref:Alpha-amylase n=1 Tax=Podospora fimiseda TaxID=252190 RepID=A0AAN7BMY8_9PEZI|nr:alpha-amylase [Podospora fimiseda]